MNNSPSERPSHFKPKIILLAFAFIVCVPFAAAWYLFHGDHSRLKLNHHGQLIKPVINVVNIPALDSEQLKGKWWLVYIAPRNCLETCHDTIYNMRQINTALGKNAERLGRLFVAHPDCPQSMCETYLNEHYADMRKVSLQQQDFSTLFTSDDPQRSEMLGDIYILDPQGNIMMRYSTDTDPKGILTDLKRLLRVAKT